MATAHRSADFEWTKKFPETATAREAVGVAAQIVAAAVPMLEARGLSGCFPLVVIAIGHSKALRRGVRPALSNRLSTEEWSTFYVMDDEQFFQCRCEEYRCPVELGPEFNESVAAIFRSFRSLEDIRNGWEFFSAIYLFPARLDV
jgi:hypothetical protein